MFKELLKLLVRFVPPYKKYFLLNLFFNILSTILTLFSFATIIPILEILFKINETSYQWMEWGSGSAKDVFINNFYYIINEQIATSGQSWVLFLMGVLLVVMTFFKTMSAYLSSYFIIPLRTGVVRDIRNFLYDKVTSLPIGFFTSERKG
ncbi:MAG: ABC transporter ATP-binding protein, partial [Bacteroidaceae bacterium]|nr:ABC transporter ATP-binding protein [Bacteroidaceae bacterium]